MGLNTTTTHTVEILPNIFSTHAHPKVLISHDGPQFTSNEFTSFMLNKGIQHKIALYHPATNGLAERFVQELKKSLKRNEMASRSTPKKHHLVNFLLHYRCTPHSITGFTPTELLFKRKLRTRLHLVQPRHVEFMRGKQQWGESTGRELEHGESVRVFDCRYKHRTVWQRGTVMQRLGPVAYMVQIRGKTRHVHVDHLRANTSCNSQCQRT